MCAKNIPFPQANDIDRLYTMLELTYYKGLVKKCEYEQHFSNISKPITNRQVDYYINALIFLELLERANNRHFSISKLGEDVMVEPLYRRFDKFTNVLLNNETISFAYSLSNQGHDLQYFIHEVASEIAEKYKMHPNTALRRTSTIISWVKWIKHGYSVTEEYIQYHNTCSYSED